MYNHPSTSVLIVDDGNTESIQILAARLKDIPHLNLDVSPKLPAGLNEPQAIITTHENFSDADCCRMEAFVRAGGGWLNIITPSVKALPSIFGVRPQPAGPMCELRILFDQRDHPLALRLPDAFYVTGHYHPLALDSDDAEMILYTDWHYRHSAVLAGRRFGDGAVACSSLQDFGHPILHQIFYRLIRQLGGIEMPEKPLGIGILGYAPSVGRLHGQGTAETAGLELKAACDLSSERLIQARLDFPDIKTFESSDDLGNEPDIDLVIIATAPNTHAKLALQMIEAGKHVVCEKPLALNRAETAAMAEAAAKQGVHLSCHQNRRWDVDYLTIKQALADGLIGEMFYLETFVGGFFHPCGYWHSDAAVSGGTAYDWGGHYIDWIVSLFSGRIETVIGTRHKRVWHDVTNADQERIQIRFEGGREAEFMHSDIAAARKPKWYLLGDQGAILGHWQDVTEYQIDPLHYFHRHDIPATEMPPDLTVYLRSLEGKVTILKPPIPDRPIFGFHRNLADHLLTGETLTAPLDDSIRAVAVLEAAARSMQNGGSLEAVDV
jgi:predicted dehydrogenase